MNSHVTFQVPTRKLILLVLAALLLAGCGSPAPAAPTTTPTVTVTTRPTRTATPSPMPSPTPTLIPTATPTLTPAAAGIRLAPVTAPIIEMNLSQMRVLGEWGRGRVDGLVWSPAGGWIAVTTPLGVSLYNPASLNEPLQLESDPASRPVFSEDGRYLAVDVAPQGSGGGVAFPPHTVQVWDLGSGSPARIAVLETGGQARMLAFQGGDLMALTRRDAGAQFQRWDFAQGVRTKMANLDGGETAVEAVFSADLLLAATRGTAGPVRLWRLSDGINLATTREAVSEAGPLAFSPDGKLLAVGYPDNEMDYFNSNRVRIWRVPEGPGLLSDLAYEVSAPFTGEGSIETLISLAWSPDGAYLAAGYEDYRVAVWRSQGMLKFRELRGSTLPRFLSWGPQLAPDDPNLRLAVGGLEVWSMALKGGRSERTAYVDDFLPGVYDMQFSPDGSMLALAGYGTIDLRLTADGSRKLVISGMNGAVNSIAFNPDGDLLAAACQDGTTRLYQTSNGLYLASIGAPTYPLRAVDFSNDGLWLATTGENALIRIYRVADGIQMFEVAEPYVSYMLRFSPNTDQIASLTTTGVRLRGFSVIKDAISVDWESWIGGVGMTGMAYSPGEEFLALVGNDVVRVVEPLTGQDVYTLYESSGALPWAVAFSPDNAFMAVGWSDGQIRVYWAQDGRLMRAIQAHPESIRRLTFSRDGRLLASLGEEGAIRIWGVSE